MFQKGGYIGFKKKMTHKEKKDWILEAKYSIGKKRF